MYLAVAEAKSRALAHLILRFVRNFICFKRTFGVAVLRGMPDRAGSI